MTAATGRHLTCSTSTAPTGTPGTTSAGPTTFSTRLDRHACGHGARLVAVIWQAGIGFTCVRICEGTRHTERAIKNAGGAVRVLPGLHPPSAQRPTGPLTPGDFAPRTYLNLAGRR